MAIVGKHSTKTSQAVNTSVFTALPRADAELDIEFKKPTTSILFTSAKAAAPATPEAAKVVNPTERAKTPTPTAAAATPRRAIAPASPSIAGITGDNKAPAAPTTANPPAKETRPFAISVQLIDAKDFKTGTKIASDADITNIAADAPKVPFMAFMETDNIAIEPPKVTIPFAISSKDIPLIFKTTSPMIFKASAVATNPTPIVNAFFGSSLIARVISANAPPIARSPFPI